MDPNSPHDPADHGPPDPEPITRPEAKQLIDDVPGGFLIGITLSPIPVLGDVPDDELQMKATIKTYQFGDPPSEIPPPSFHATAGDIDDDDDDDDDDDGGHRTPPR